MARSHNSWNHGQLDVHKRAPGQRKCYEWMEDNHILRILVRSTGVLDLKTSSDQAALMQTSTSGKKYDGNAFLGRLG